MLESKVELAGRAPTDGSGTPAPTLVFLRAPTPDPSSIQGSDPILALGPASMVAPTFHKKFCQQLIKTYAATIKLLE